jgi:hypothetical protein
VSEQKANEPPVYVISVPSSIWRTIIVVRDTSCLAVQKVGSTESQRLLCSTIPENIGADCQISSIGGEISMFP